MKTIEHKDSEIKNNIFWGGPKAVVLNNVVGDLQLNDDGTITYKLIGYGIITPDGWDSFNKQYMLRQPIWRQILNKITGT